MSSKFISGNGIRSTKLINLSAFSLRSAYPSMNVHFDSLKRNAEYLERFTNLQVSLKRPPSPLSSRRRHLHAHSTPPYHHHSIQ